jgi:hypothetical protein
VNVSLGEEVQEVQWKVLAEEKVRDIWARSEIIRRK